MECEVNSPKYKSSDQHHGKAVDKSPEGKHNLSGHDESTEHHRADTYSKHPVQKEPSEHRQNDIGPRVERVEESVLCSVNLHHLGGVLQYSVFTEKMAIKILYFIIVY